MLRFKLLLIILLSALFVASVALWAAASDDDEKVPLSDVPAKVLQAADKAVSGGDIKEVEKEVENGVAIYDVKKVVDDVSYEIEVTADGVVKKIEREENDNTNWNFENIPVGQIPAGWKVEATNQKGPLATWRVIKDKTAPSGEKVFAMTSPNHHFGGAFNICWTKTKDASFLDGEIEVRFKAVTGTEDQGGGVIWRAQDKDNYYIARFNPLENNFRIYYVRDGARKTLADTKIALPAGKWHTMKIVQHGNHFEGYLNGRKLLKGTDSLFTKPGGVGLWTKADAVTSFDNLKVVKRGNDEEKNDKENDDDD